jgi:hypothetical protein
MALSDRSIGAVTAFRSGAMSVMRAMVLDQPGTLLTLRNSEWNAVTCFWIPGSGLRPAPE